MWPSASKSYSTSLTSHTGTDRYFLCRAPDEKQVALHTQSDSVGGAFESWGRLVEGREYVCPISGPLKEACPRTEMAGRTAFAIHWCFSLLLFFFWQSGEQKVQGLHIGWGWFFSKRNMLCKVSFHMAVSVLGLSLPFHPHSPSASTMVCETDLSGREKTNQSKDKPICLSNDSFRSRIMNQTWPGSLQETSRRVLLCS